MEKSCFLKKDAGPPVCGLHGVPLVQRESSDSLATSRFGAFAFFVCPVSGYVIDGLPKSADEGSQTTPRRR